MNSGILAVAVGAGVFYIVSELTKEQKGVVKVKEIKKEEEEKKKPQDPANYQHFLDKEREIWNPGPARDFQTGKPIDWNRFAKPIGT
jgi:hypothetical protein